MKKKTPELIYFARIVRVERYKKNMSQVQFSEKIGCHVNHIGRIERAEVDPSFTMIIKIAKALDVHPYVFFYS